MQEQCVQLYQSRICFPRNNAWGAIRVFLDTKYDVEKFTVFTRHREALEENNTTLV